MGEAKSNESAKKRHRLDDVLRRADYHYGAAGALKDELENLAEAAERLVRMGEGSRAIQYELCAQALEDANAEVSRLRALLHRARGSVYTDALQAATSGRTESKRRHETLLREIDKELGIKGPNDG